MDLSTAQIKLHSIGQDQLLRYWKALSFAERDHLLKQVQEIDVDTLRVQQRLVAENGKSRPFADVEPLGNWDVATQQSSTLLFGRKQVANGKVGCLVVAGGQGTRLGFSGPKGIFPVTKVRHKTLYRFLAEKVQAASIQSDTLLSIAFMTSSATDAVTRGYFEDNHYFGLKASQIDFFMQGTLPIIGDDGELLLQDRGEIALGPDGNGCALHHFYQSGIWQRWKNKGIEAVCFIQIDNPLSNPFDAELVGYHFAQGKEVTLKGCLRRNAEEKVGVVVKKNGQAGVVEYTEMSKADKEARTDTGELLYPIANLSSFCFSMGFIAKLCAAPLIDFPLHLAHKPLKVLNDAGLQKEVKAWKCERFIFDVLPYADDVSVLVYPRHLCYAPLKNAFGQDSLQEVQDALQAYDRLVFEELTGASITLEEPFELSPQFYYPTPELLSKWKGAMLPDGGYIIS